MGKLIIDGNKVYEIDEECLEKKCHKEQEELKKRMGTEARAKP